MAVNKSNEEIDREFFNLVRSQVRPDMSKTLCDYLAAAPAGREISESAVSYVLGKLWLDQPKPEE